MNKLQQLQAKNAQRKLDELIEAIALHRTTRYGSPPTPPYFSVDIDLYKKAGIA